MTMRLRYLRSQSPFSLFSSLSIFSRISSFSSASPLCRFSVLFPASFIFLSSNYISSISPPPSSSSPAQTPASIPVLAPTEAPAAARVPLPASVSEKQIIQIPGTRRLSEGVIPCEREKEMIKQHSSEEDHNNNNRSDEIVEGEFTVVWLSCIKH